MVTKMSGHGGRSVNSLAAEVGVCRGTLSRWKREAASVGPMTNQRKSNRTRAATRVRPKNRSAAEKFRLLMTASGLGEPEFGEFLRREGIHEADLVRWREGSLEGLADNVSTKAETARASKKVRQLEKELRRKDKALAEAAALLVLQKKVRQIWGDEDDDT
jgi:transposase